MNPPKRKPQFIIGQDPPSQDSKLPTNQSTCSIRAAESGWSLLNQGRPVELLPYLVEFLGLQLDLLREVFLGRFDVEALEPQGSSHHFVEKPAVPQLLVFYDVRIAVPQPEVDVAVLNLFWNLLLQPSFLLADVDDIFMGSPVALHAFEGLLEEERQIVGLLQRDPNALNVDVGVGGGKLLQEDRVKIHPLHHLDQAFLVVSDFVLDCTVQPDPRLLVLHRSDDVVLQLPEGLHLRQSNIRVV